MLRLRKDLPITRTYLNAQDDWLRRIFPLFKDHEIVIQSLFDIRHLDLLPTLNADLRARESATPPKPLVPRAAKRVGVYLSDDDYGLLVTAMMPLNDREYIFEMKPKWLVQSPSAPRNAKRCRQCAHVARKNAKRSKCGESLLSTFCPLDLVSKNPLDRARAAALLVDTRYPYRIAQLARWLQQTDILVRLADLQRTLDPLGLLRPTRNDEDMCVAMTLRDCSVFVRFPVDGGPATEFRLGDLDLKCAKKLPFWRHHENSLVQEGWYTGKEKASERQPLGCHLNRHRNR